MSNKEKTRLWVNVCIILAIVWGLYFWLNGLSKDDVRSVGNAAQILQGEE